MSDISNRLATVRHKIRVAAEKSGRPPEDVSLVVVSKTMGVDHIREAVEGGAVILGESRIQEAREKVPIIGRDKLQWHLVGHLQQNKVKYIFELFDLIHSVDSVDLAREIDRRGALRGESMGILLQVNIAHDPAKFGVDPEELPELLREISQFKNVSIKGLMAISPFSVDPEDSRPHYQALRELRDRVTAKDFDLKELSMGMSNDFEVAVEEGSTMVRVGSAIFGERKYV